MDARRMISRISWAHVVFLLIAGAGQLIGNVAAVAAGGGLDINALMMITYASMYLLAFPVFCVMMRRIPSWHKEEIPTIPLKDMAAWLVFCLGIMTAGNYFAQILLLLLGKGNAVSPVDEMVGTLNPWVMVLITVVIAPVMEELIFRKMMLDRIVPFGQWRAIVLSGLFFGLFHGNLNQLFYAALLGMVFAYLYTSTGNLRSCIILHMIVNLIGGVVPMILFRLENELLMTTGLVCLLSFQLVCLVTAVIIGIVFVRKQRLFPPLVELTGGPFWFRALTAPGMVVFLIFQGIAIVVTLVLS